MNFWGHYNSLDKKKKKALKERILYETGVSYATFYSWKTRGKIPKYEQTIIEKILNENNV